MINMDGLTKDDIIRGSKIILYTIIMKVPEIWILSILIYRFLAITQIGTP